MLLCSIHSPLNPRRGPLRLRAGSGWASPGPGHLEGRQQARLCLSRGEGGKPPYLTSYSLLTFPLGTLQIALRVPQG